MKKKSRRPAFWDLDNPQGIIQIIGESEKRLGLPPSFCRGLAEENDWSLIVRSSALLEGAISAALKRKIGTGAVAEFVDARRFHEKRKLAVDLELLTKDQDCFVGEISEMRNHLVHDLQHIDFNFRKHLEKSDKQVSQKIVANLLRIVPIKDRNVPWLRGRILETPRLFAWLGTLYVTARLQLLVRRIEFREDHAREVRKIERAELKNFHKLFAAIERYAKDPKTRPKLGQLLHDISMEQQWGIKGRKRSLPDQLELSSL
jgi:hypothetical protein